MPTKSSHRSAGSASTSATEASSAMVASLNVLSEVARQQVSLMTQAACAVLGSSEALGKIQQQAAHQASLRHQAAAETLSGEVQPLDVLSIQSDLLRQDMQEAAQYWAQLASTAMRSQLDIMGRMTEALNTGSQGGLSTALDAWRSAVAATPNGGSGSRSGVH